MSTLDPQAMIAEARAQCGLADFGDEDFRAPLEVLARSMVEEARLSARGREFQHLTLVQALVTRLRVHDYCARHPAIEREPLPAPLVIAGLQRTGTTKLQRVIATDPRWHVLLLWESMFPVPLADDADPAGERARRIALARDYAEEHNTSGAGAAHLLDPLAPEEEVLLMLKSFLVPCYDMHTPAHQAWIEAADKRPMYRDLRRLLQFLQWQRGGTPGRRWLLKAGEHLANLGVLFDVFPDAKVVQTHRHPAASVASMLQLVDLIHRRYSDAVDRLALGRLWLANLSHTVASSLRYRDAHPGTAILDVAFRDVVADAAGTVRRIYAFAGAEFTPDTAGAIQAWDRDNPAGKHGEHHYALADFGLDEAQVESAFADYIARFGHLF
ncbi:MAG: sulfotransferase [Gammaproteobacteria bacterium]